MVLRENLTRNRNVSSYNKMTPPKTNVTLEKQPFEHVSPMKNSNSSASHVIFQGGICSSITSVISKLQGDARQLIFPILNAVEGPITTIWCATRPPTIYIYIVFWHPFKTTHKKTGSKKSKKSRCFFWCTWNPDPTEFIGKCRI